MDEEPLQHRPKTGLRGREGREKEDEKKREEREKGEKERKDGREQSIKRTSGTNSGKKYTASHGKKLPSLASALFFIHLTPSSSSPLFLCHKKLKRRKNDSDQEMRENEVWIDVGNECGFPYVQNQGQEGRG